MYCVVRREGRDTRVHVNRLTRKYHWTEAMPDTAIWSTKNITDILQEDKPDEPKDETPIQVGETIIFPAAMEGEYNIPFGIGVVTDASDQSNICIQWLGNEKGKTNLAFRLCWHQASTSQIYYRDHKIHGTHTPATGSNVHANEVIAHGTNILNSEGKIASRIRHILEDNPMVRQAWGDAEEPIFTMILQSRSPF